MLKNIDDATLGQIVVVWPGQTTTKGLGHIYQFALQNAGVWPKEAHYPEAEPICGAARFERRSHCNLPEPAAAYGAVCTSCVITLALNYPHLFEKGGP